MAHFKPFFRLLLNTYNASSLKNIISIFLSVLLITFPSFKLHCAWCRQTIYLFFSTFYACPCTTLSIVHGGVFQQLSFCPDLCSSLSWSWSTDFAMSQESENLLLIKSISYWFIIWHLEWVSLCLLYYILLLSFWRDKSWFDALYHLLSWPD